MKTYNGIVELTIGPLAGKTEVEIVKQKAAELPQTMLAFMDNQEKQVINQAENQPQKPGRGGKRPAKTPNP